MDALLCYYANICGYSMITLLSLCPSILHYPMITLLSYYTSTCGDSVVTLLTCTSVVTQWLSCSVIVYTSVVTQSLPCSSIIQTSVVTLLKHANKCGYLVCYPVTCLVTLFSQYENTDHGNNISLSEEEGVVYCTLLTSCRQ